MDDLINKKFTTYRVIEDTESTRYLVGLRAVTLVPASAKDDRLLSAYPDTVRISVTEGESAKRVTRIFTEDLYIWAGSEFLFPGKDLVICAHRILIVQPQGSTASSIYFNCSGKTDYSTSKAADPSPKKAAQNSWSKDPQTWGDLRQVNTKVENAKSANNGADENSTAPSAGNIAIVGSLINLGGADTILLVGRCDGARGKAGQSGGNGGDGPDGAQFDTDWHIPGSLANGGNGTDGGKGGKGGAGGPGGCVFDLTTSKENTDAHNKDVWFALGISSVKGGEAGPGGDGGLAGKGGQGQNYRVYQVHGYQGGSFTEETAKGTGSSGSDGKAGGSGSQGTSGAPGCIYSISKMSTALASSIRAMSHDIPHLSMVMSRLLFEYQLLTCTQAFPESTEAQQQEKANFQRTVTWFREVMSMLQTSPTLDDGSVLASATTEMNDTNKARTSDMAVPFMKRVMLEHWNGSATGRAQLLQRFSLSPLTGDIRQVLDLYGRPLNTLARPHLQMSDLLSSTKLLGDIETRKAALDSALKDVDTAKAKRSDAAEALKASIQGFDSLQTKAVATLDDQYKVVTTAKNKTDNLQIRASGLLQGLWSTIKSQVACSDAKRLVEAVALVCMFVQPEIGAVFAVGASASTLAASTDLGANLDTDKGPIKKEALQGKIIVLQKGLTQKALQAQLEIKSTEIRSLMGADSKYVNAIVTERDTFEQLCDEHFATLEKSTSDKDMLKVINSARAAFDELVDAAQELHKEVAEYNRLALALAKLNTDNAKAESDLANLQGKTDLDLPFLDLFFGFYADLYSFQKAAVMRIMFDIVRNCNAVFLQRTTLTDGLIRLGSFENISADELKKSCTTHFEADVDRFLNAWLHNQPTNEDERSITLTPAKTPRLFESFKTKRSFVFYFNSINAVKLYGFPSSWFDVRLKDAKVFLPGAFNTASAVAADASSTSSTTKRSIKDQVVDVTIELGSQFVVEDKDFQAFEFETDGQTYTFTYNYGETPGQFVPKSKRSAELLGSFIFGMGVGDKEQSASLNFSSPIRSPFCKWTVSVSDNINIDAVTEILIDMDLQVRTTTNKRPASSV